MAISVVSSPGTLSPFATLDIQLPPSFHGCPSSSSSARSSASSSCFTMCISFGKRSIPPNPPEVNVEPVQAPLPDALGEVILYLSSLCRFPLWRFLCSVRFSRPRFGFVFTCFFCFGVSFFSILCIFCVSFLQFVVVVGMLTPLRFACSSLFVSR